MADYQVRRSPDQLAIDRDRLADQVRDLTETDDQVWAMVLGMLSERRAPIQAAGRLRPSGKGADQVLVAEGQLLVRTTPGHDRGGRSRSKDRDRARTALRDSGVAPDEEFDHRHPELADELLLFRARPGRGHGAVRAARERLRARDVDATEVRVSALARPVIKSLHGPAPTTVAYDAVPPAPTSRAPLVAVIDTGIAEHDHAGHGHADSWLTPVEERLANIDPLDAFPGKGLDYGAGHGTFAAGIVRQTGPAARVRAYRALDSAGFGTELDVAAAMIRAVGDKAAVLSMSLGCRGHACPPALAAALRWIDRNTDRDTRPVVVAAAGNYGDDVPVWPAADPSVLSVAGLTARGAGADWSSHGDWVDCSAVGEGVVSTFVRGTEDPTLSPAGPEKPDTYAEHPWAVWTGTSFAAPQVAGRIAQAMLEHGDSAEQARDRLLAGVQELPGYGRALEILPGT